MKIHEYQAKEILKSYGISVPQGRLARTPEETWEAADQLGGENLVVKAQIHAGGRGKGGGVRPVNGPEAAQKAAGEILGRPLMTPQTGPEGKMVTKVLVEKGVEIAREYYLGITLDRQQSTLTFMASQSGGMDIEEVAVSHPETILKERVDPALGFLGFQARNLAYGLGWEGALVKEGTSLVEKLFKLYQELDASLMEINPLVLTREGGLLCLDAKINFDENALFRHPELSALRDPAEEDPLELEASRYNLNYIRLDGNVGAMVNGAGLAMATMDVIKLAGAEPANFLDVGGGANAGMVTNGFRIILSDPRVKAILVNIFGGILRCDVLAQGLIEAARAIRVEVPLIIRLEGTNYEQGRTMLHESGLRFMVAEGLKDAARKVALVVKG
jgi:succinyl-CoA synthetase beta subunit